MASNVEFHNSRKSKQDCLLPNINTEIKKGCNTGYTLVLDLDETLIHATGNSNVLEECIINTRPGAKCFVEEMSKYYELVIFTAGTKDYADYALKYIDPEEKIMHRLYREHVTQK